MNFNQPFQEDKWLDKFVVAKSAISRIYSICQDIPEIYNESPEIKVYKEAVEKIDSICESFAESLKK